MTRRKRAFDICVAGLGLLILSPVMLLIAAAVLCDSGRPVLFRQERVGRAGRRFSLWKFRTMVVDAERAGGQLTVGSDPRVTRIGHILRLSKLDELPQLVNVLQGTMSLVGPRPEVPRYVALYDDAQREVLRLTPGITDPASLTYRNETVLLGRSSDPERTYTERLMPHKIEMNLAYARNATLRSDCGILLRTVRALFNGVEAA
jgi:lipopolysaccharide/colanic/teichoic acid biosynthesis glycosyltransferase